MFQFIARYLLYTPERYSGGKFRNFPPLLSHVCPAALSFDGYILFALVNAVVFAAPTAKTPSFWIAYGFTAVAFAAQPFTGGESVRRPHKYD